MDLHEYTPRQEESLPQDQFEGELRLLPVPPEHSGHVSSAITCLPVSNYGSEAFLLSGVLSAAECQHYITQSEKLGFEEMLGVKKTYRNCKRILVDSAELADLLWGRIRPYVEGLEIRGDPHAVHVHGPEALLQGTWAPVGLNKIFRICRYHPGGHFAPHFDGHFTVSSRMRSMKTLMLYLNGDFTGGSTNFVDEKQTLYMDDKGKYCAEDKNVLCGVQPETGLAIVFNHHRLHEGQALGDGVKYILRTDIMFEKVTNDPVDPKEDEAMQLVQEAERLEARGENMAAMALYRKAFKLSPSVEKSFGN